MDSELYKTKSWNLDDAGPDRHMFVLVSNDLIPSLSTPSASEQSLLILCTSVFITVVISYTVLMDGGKRKRVTLTIEKKLKVIEAVEAGGNKKKQDIAAEFNIPVSTLSTILKNKEKIRSSLWLAVKRHRNPEFPDIEKCIYKWFVNCRGKNIPISGLLIRDKASQFAKTLGHNEFSASVGWLGNFKKRHGICFKTICGETKDVDDGTCNSWKDNLPSIVESYVPRDIFNADETALFYQCLPHKTLTLKNEKCHGGKLCLTVLLCINMDGSEK